ncbi:MAG: sigma 54-interacting transcriptional regulator [Hydrogenothermaceae bacterium]|nr:sigma 54-interacting transcriptional regulator [Hydrogenothermaceae bacterium]
MDLKILESISGGIIFITPDRKIKFINKAARELLNKKEGEFCFGSFDICSSCPLENGLKNVETHDTKLSCCKKTVCFSIKPVYENGELLGYLEEIRDSTKIANYINQIEKEKEFSKTVFESVIDAILVVDDEGRIVEYNQVAKEIICREADIKGMSIEILLNKKLADIPTSREDIFIETPALGKLKVSIVSTKLKHGNGRVISFYVVPECMLTSDSTKSSRLISKSPHMSYVIEIAKTVADTPANVLLEGETGTGKNVLAKYIHNQSSRRNKPFIKINCAAIPENLLESELFGYVKGAFTGAVKDKPGKVELADGGTLFLDEVGELPIYLQSKLLHLIQEKEFERVGDIKTRKVDIRIIAATNRDLYQLAKEGKFREDLYYRLKVISIKVPPLRERKEDIPFLVNYFIEIYSQNYKKKIKSVSPEAMKLLLDYDYPGNIRELENMIERAVILSKNGYIQIEDLPQEVVDFRERKLEKRELLYSEKDKILDALSKANGNKTLTAKILGIDRVTLWRKMKRYGIEI